MYILFVFTTSTCTMLVIDYYHLICVENLKKKRVITKKSVNGGEKLNKKSICTVYMSVV